MKKFNLREKHIHMGAFDFSVVVVFGDYKEACKFVLWKFDDKGTNLEALDKGHIPRGECLFRRGYIPIIWLPRKPKTASEPTYVRAPGQKSEPFGLRVPSHGSEPSRVRAPK